jgi:hypothetical protein
MRLNSTGLGIGTNTPLSIVDIHDNDAILNIRDNSDSSVKLRMRGNSGNDLYDIRTEIAGGYTWHDRGVNLTIHYDDVDNYIWRSNGAVERMRLNSTGLGIGTSPSFPLHVIGQSRFGTQMGIGNDPITAADLYLYSTSNTNIRLADGSTYFDLFHNDGGGTSVTLLDIDPTGTSSGTNEFRIDIDNTREVTITPTGMGLGGITAPSATLDVNGDIEVTDGSTSMQLNEDGLLTTDGVLNFVNALGGYTTTYTTGSTAAAFSGQTTISGFDYFMLSGGILEAAKDEDYFELKYQDHDGATHSSFTWDATWRFYEDGYFHTDAGIVHLNDEDTFFKFTSNKIQTYAGSSAFPKATYNVSGVTFNEGGVSSNDFRVNGTISYMIFGDAGANKVGIFEGSPSAELDVVGDTELNGDLLITDGTRIFKITQNVNGTQIGDVSGSGGNDLNLQSNSVTRINIEAEGRININDVLNLNPLSTPPNSGTEQDGDIYLHDTGSAYELRVWNGSSWQTL